MKIFKPKMEVDLTYFVENCDRLKDDFIVECIESLRDELRTIDPKMRTTKFPSSIRKSYNFIISFISTKRPHLCYRLLQHDNMECLLRRRCLSCRKNLPCTICAIKTPINIISNKTPSTRLPFKCANGRHVCQRCYDYHVHIIKSECK